MEFFIVKKLFGKVWLFLGYDFPIDIILRVNDFLPDNVIFLKIRGFLTGRFVGGCKGDIRLRRNVTLYCPWNIFFGKNIYIVFGCWFNAQEKIIVEDEVLFGPYCIVVTANHTRRGDSYRWGEPIRNKIEIGRGPWIGAHVTITSGSFMGSGCVIGAGAVVKGRIKDGSLAAGVPAIVVKSLKE